ncbi:MAG: acyl carrier protein [Rhodocyclaceae bacterium]|nr:acyl carrier protein [Rhodocyclaceae bacterium]
MDPLAKQKLRDFLLESLEKHGDKNPLTDSESIFVSGRLDSFAAMNLVMFLEENFGIDFSDFEFDVSLLDSVDAIATFVDNQG